jgi:hypothetical protein
MSDLAERLTRDLHEIAGRAAPSPDAWESILARLDDTESNPESHEMEVLMLSPNRQSPRTRNWMLATAAAVVIVAAVAVIVVATNDDEPLATADTQAAVDIANQFMTARDSWDADTLTALVADGAVISDFAVTTPADYVANADFERAMQWRFLQPDCIVNAVGPPVEVRCTYVMQNELTRVLGTGPYGGSSFTLLVDDDRIQQITNDFDFSDYSREVLDEFVTWLEANHPNQVEAMLGTAQSGKSVRVTTRESIQLWQERTAEFAAIQTALRFVGARDTWDGPAVRALVADDAEIADFAVETPDDYLAMADLERTLRWRYIDPQCAATVEGAEAHVTCGYLVQNALSQAVATGPYSGSRMVFEISDGLIRTIGNTFDHSIYGTEVLVPFTEWLDANHPGNSDVMFFTDEFEDVQRSLSPESLALWAERVPEYEAFVAAG